MLFLMPIEGEWLSIKQFIISLWNWKQGWINHLWYMGALICIYLLFPLIRSTFDYCKVIFNYWVIICLLFAFGNVILCMLVTLVYHYVMGGHEYLSYNFFNMFNPLRGLDGHAFAYFSIGCFVGGNQETIQRITSKYSFMNRFFMLIVILLSTLLLGIWGVFSSKLTGSLWDVVWNGYDTVFTLINVLAIYLLSEYYNGTGKIGRYIQMISKNTLGIYFTHEIFIHLFVRMGVKLLPCANNYLFNVIYALLIMLMCLVITLFIKRIPILRGLVV